MKRLRFEPTEDPAVELARDEAMLAAAESGELAGGVFRTWQFLRPAVVLGRSSAWRTETDPAFCQANRIPILRRCTGGASVVGGPGCLMYSVVIPTGGGALRQIDAAHDFLMTRLIDAVRAQAPSVQRGGICDGVIGDRKFSGNSLRITRGHLLYHGTILYAADLELIDAALAHAPRQPDYRGGRDHRSFIANLDIDPVRLADDLAGRLDVRGEATVGRLDDGVAQLMASRYGLQSWHRRH